MTNEYIEKIKSENSTVEVPADLEPIIQAIAAKVHDTWARGRVDQGWSYGPARDDAQKLHPCLVPFEDLSTDEQSFDLETARSTVANILAAGYKIVRA